MPLNRRQVIPDHLAKVSPPTEYVTENGFSITRRSEVDSSVLNSARECHFLVRGASGGQREVTVAFNEELIARVQRQRRRPISATSLLWSLAAEQCLAKYLWKNDKVPDGGHLDVAELEIDELLLTIHWRDAKGD